MGQQPQQEANGQYSVVPARPASVANGAGGHNPYEFIMNSTAPPKRSFVNSGSLLVRLSLIVGALVVVVIIAVVVASSLAPKGSVPGMLSMVSRQQEILRIAADANKKAVGQDTRNFVANVQAAITTDRLQITGFASGHGGNITPQVLAADRSTTTDTLLLNAASTNTYDTAAARNLAEQLQDYQTLALNTYKQAKNKQSKQILQTAYGNATRLLKQSEPLVGTN